MSKSWEEIVHTVEQRRRSETDTIRKMAEVRDRYHGDYVIPVPEVEGEPALPPTAPALIGAAIDSTAMLAGSTEPVILCPPVTQSRTSERRSHTRSRALRANWIWNQMPILRRRAYRQMAAYGVFSLLVTPDFEAGRARVEVRDPLATFGEQKAIDDVSAPRNIAYVFGRSSEWLRAKFPSSHQVLALTGRTAAETLWDVVEWVDEDDIVFGVAGQRHQGFVPSGYAEEHRPVAGFELRRVPNRAGMVPAVAPRRITLERVAGQVSQTVGLFDLMNRLMSLDVLAAEKAIFPTPYIIGREGQAPQLIGNKWTDGRDGGINLLLDAQTVGQLISSSGPLVHPVIDRIERAIRISGGVAPFATGETVGSLRTGRAMGELSAASVDPRIQEMQEIMQEALQVVNRAVLGVEKGYWPNRKFFVFSGGSGAITEYTPSKDFDTTENSVRYPFIGVDASQLAVLLPQRVGAGLMAVSTAMVMDPFVEDPEEEQQRIWSEEMDRSMFQSIAARAQQGGIPPADVARIAQLLKEGLSPAEAVIQADREAQERQAAQVPAEAPEAQPGLAVPGEGAESQPTNPFPEVQPGLGRAAELSQVLGAVRAGIGRGVGGE